MSFVSFFRTFSKVVFPRVAGGGFYALGVLSLFFCFLLPAQAEPLRIGYMLIGTHNKFMVAKELGFFAQEGLEVELFPFMNTPDGISALLSHKIDAAAFGTSAPLVYFSRGSKLKIIGGITSGGSTFIARPEIADKVRSIADFKGKRVATLRLTTVDAVLRGALKDAGLEWGKDVTIIELKSAPSITEALKSNLADIGVTWSPHDMRAVNEGLKILFWSDDIYPKHVCCRLIVNDQANSARNVKLLRALLRAEKYVAENKDGTVAAVEKYLKVGPDMVKNDVYDPHAENSTDPYLNGLRKFWSIMTDSGFIEAKDKRVEDMVVLKDYETALNSLAKENPQDTYWQKLLKDYPEKNTLKSHAH
jgi:NitT/TauT family transport system substrate-binding protein